jgi:hypothetical protein
MTDTYTDQDGDIHSTPASLLRAHNFTFEPQMGGGCQAWAFYADDGTHWLMCCEDDPGHVPEKLNDPCSVGQYDNESADMLQEFHVQSVPEVIALVWYGDKEHKV